MNTAEFEGIRPFPLESFEDVLTANAEFAGQFAFDELTGTARRGLAIVTCMDSRISPLAVVGMQPGDAKILRNAGARVTDDVLRTLVLATYLLGVDRILVMPHTECRMTAPDASGIHSTIWNQYGVDTRSLDFRTTDDLIGALRHDVTRIRSFPYLPEGVEVAGAIYSVRTGALEPTDC